MGLCSIPSGSCHRQTFLSAKTQRSVGFNPVFLAMRAKMPALIHRHRRMTKCNWKNLDDSAFCGNQLDGGTSIQSWAVLCKRFELWCSTTGSRDMALHAY